MNRKIKVAVIFGGKSAEHEVSLQSAKNVIDALDKDRYEITPIGIDKTGRWLIGNSSELVLNSNSPKSIALNKIRSKLALVPGKLEGRIVSLPSLRDMQPIDVVFPVLHGPFGEDGTIQGLLKLADIPFVGAGVLGSAIGMDKDVMKRLLKADNIPVAEFRVYRSLKEVSFPETSKELGLPLFIKPANLGSSIGVHKARNQEEFQQAIEDSFSYDTKVIVEEFIKGREIECSVLGNEEPIASLPGEIKLTHEFYDYEAKYIDENGAALEIPAKLKDLQVRRIQDLAIRTFKVLECSGMARVDFFLTEDGRVLVNEINTIPGFTKVSMYPKLWEVSGISYSKLMNRLVELALTRYHKEHKA